MQLPLPVLFSLRRVHQPDRAVRSIDKDASRTRLRSDTEADRQVDARIFGFAVRWVCVERIGRLNAKFGLALAKAQAGANRIERAAAKAARLDFVPLQFEYFDLVLRQADYFRPPLQTLIKLLSGSIFTQRAGELTGYDVSQAGTIRYAP